MAAGSVKELADPLLENAYDMSEMKNGHWWSMLSETGSSVSTSNEQKMAGLLSAKVPLLSMSKGSTHLGLTAMRSVTEASRTSRVLFRTIPRAGEYERSAAEEAREIADNTAENSKRMAEEAKERAKEATYEAKKKAKGTTYEAKEKAKSAAEEAQNKAAEMKEKAREKSEGVGQRAKESTSQATEKVQSIGGQAK